MVSQGWFAPLVSVFGMSFTRSSIWLLMWFQESWCRGFWVMQWLFALLIVVVWAFLGSCMILCTRNQNLVCWIDLSWRKFACSLVWFHYFLEIWGNNGAHRSRQLMPHPRVLALLLGIWTWLPWSKLDNGRSVGDSNGCQLKSGARVEEL